MAPMTPSEILNLPMQGNDADATTIREYLATLLRTLWIEKEGFNGKRPFGNSSWDFDIYDALIRGGAISGSFDADGYIDDCDDEAGYRLVKDAIEFLCGTNV